MIYSVKNQRFKKNGKFFSPASHFFIDDDNTIIADGERDQFIEENYSRNEGLVAKALEKIKAADQNFGLDQQEIHLLNYFAAELFWRLPAHRAIVDSVNNIDALWRLGLVSIDRKTMQPVSREKFDRIVKDNPIYLKFLRANLPANTFWDLADCTWGGRIVTFPADSPVICSDQPIILRHPEKLDIFRDDLILPLAANKVMFRIKGMKSELLPWIKFYIDMLVLMQACAYACCVDREYLELLKLRFEEDFESVDALREALFDELTKSVSD